jgi:predicted dehydrogenase
VVGVGVVGIGFMGMTHFRAYRQVPGARVVAICTRDPQKLAGDWSRIRGNFGEPGSPNENLEGIARYSKFEDLVADPQVDLVDICTTSHLHSSMAISALRAGKHVLVEKPIALRPADAGKMLRAAAAAKRQLLVAQVLPYIPEFRFALEVIRSGSYGPLLAGHLRRIISRPDWSADIADPEKTGGPVIDLHIHDNHFVVLACGAPRGVYARGTIEDGVVTHVESVYDFGRDGPALSASSGFLAQKEREFSSGFEFYFEKASLYYDGPPLQGHGMPLTVVSADRGVWHPELPPSGPQDWFVAELTQAVRAISEGDDPGPLAPQPAAVALEISVAEARSAHTGRPVRLRTEKR